MDYDPNTIDDTDVKFVFGAVGVLVLCMIIGYIIKGDDMMSPEIAKECEQFGHITEIAEKLGC